MTARYFLSLFAIVGTASLGGCNPLAYDELLEGAWVEDFTLQPPTQSNVHGSVAVTYAPDGDGYAHVLMAGPNDGMLAWWSLNRGADVQEQYPTLDKTNALVNPIKDTQSSRVSGIVPTPAPTAGDLTPHALVAYTSIGEPDKARIVRVAVPAFVRTNLDPNEDVLNPLVRGAHVPGFGRHLAAINLDAGQDDPNLEVMVGSELGPLIFDNLDHNRSLYAEVKATLPKADVTGDNEPNGYGFTLCERPDVSGMAAGYLLPGQPVFVVADPTGLTLMGAHPAGTTNLVGAPIYACNLGQIPAPAGSSPLFGRALRVDDLNVDGVDDLVVGDPGANRVHVYLGTPSGLLAQPTTTIAPSEHAKEFGYSIGRADLGGKMGATLLVGAPGSNVDGSSGVGKVFVYDRLGQGVRAVLADMTPEKGSRYGEWAGGVHISGRDELVVIGVRGGRVHIAIADGDPYPE